jgi:hypothetical protein
MSVGMAYVTCGLQAGSKLIYRAGKPKQGRSEQRAPMSFALLAVVSVVGALGLVLLVYYLVGRRWV